MSGRVDDNTCFSWQNVWSVIVMSDIVHRNKTGLWQCMMICYLKNRSLSLFFFLSKYCVHFTSVHKALAVFVWTGMNVLLWLISQSLNIIIMLVQTVLNCVFWFHTEKDLTGCDRVEQERKQEISGAAIFFFFFLTDVTFLVAAEPSLVLVSPWLRAGSCFFLVMSITQIGFIFNF